MSRSPSAIAELLVTYMLPASSANAGDDTVQISPKSLEAEK